MQVVRTYLELSTPAAFRSAPDRSASSLSGAPAAPPAPPALSALSDSRGGSELLVERVARPTAALYRHLYRTVGAAFHWRDRWDWSDEEIERHLARPEITIHLARRGEATAGWYELRRVPEDGSVEIAYFGLLPGEIGRGLGRVLLEHAVRDAWSLGASRVWLHTCTLDHPHALPNYLARGFRAYKTEVYEVEP